MEEEEEDDEARAMDFDVDAPLAQSFMIKKRKDTRKKKGLRAGPNSPPDSTQDPEPAQLPAATERLNDDASPEIRVSEFDNSVENHLNAVDMIAELCGRPERLDANQEEEKIKRLSSSITFLREWSDFNYPPRIVKFACQHNSKEKDVFGEITLPQFSAASVPKKEMQNGTEASARSSKDFVMHVGGAVWALDWCPRVDRNTENHIKSEFVAVAAHPPESSYHKIGAPLTGRGVIQIWCLLTAYVKENVHSQGNKKSKSNSQKKITPRSSDPAKQPRPRGRPRKKPLDDSAKKIDTLSQYVQPLAIEYPMGSPGTHSSDWTSGNVSKHVYAEESVGTHKDSNEKERANPLLTAPKGRRNKVKGRIEVQLHDSDLNILRKCQHGESALVNPLESDSHLDSMITDKITSPETCDTDTFKNSIPMDVALPRMMLCLAHNGKVAWDVKWRPVRASDPESTSILGYLAVLLGNGTLEVWEVPLPDTVKLVYPTGQESIDPRFIKLRPVFRCSMLKCGDRQSIPLTVEWTVSSPHDMILAGCHDGVVALWKFSASDSFTETRPLLSFSADTGPIRTLAWAPFQSDLESANVIVTAGHRGFKFWDIRDPFRPLWDVTVQGITYGLDWLPDPRCVFGSTEDGILWLLNLEKLAHDIPVTGKCLTVSPKQGFHSLDCSSFSIWSVQASRLTGMVAYCGEEGTTFCFQPTSRSVKDPSRNRVQHYLCGSLLEEEHAIIVASPPTNSSFQKRSPSLKRSGPTKELEKRANEQKAICYRNDPLGDNGSDGSLTVTNKQAPKSTQFSQSQSIANQETLEYRGEDMKRKGISKGEKGDEIEVFPAKIVAMHRVRWNVNKGSEKWLCYGGAAGLVRCQEVDFSVFQ